MSAVSGTISDIDSTLTLLDRTVDEDAIIKLTLIKDILGSDLFGSGRIRSEESMIKKRFSNSLVIISC